MAASGCHFSFLDMTDRSTMSQTTDIQDGWIFFGLLTLLMWAPLPLASNRFWAAGLLLIMAVVLLVGTVWAWRRSRQSAWQRLLLFRWPLALLTVFGALAWLQTAPLPAPWVAALSPKAALAQIPAQWMTLSLDVYQSRYMASLSFVYLSVFGVALLTVRSAERLDRLAQVLVWSGVMQAALAAVLLSLKAEYRIFYVNIAHHDAVGSFVNRNHLAGYLCMTLSVGIGLMLARLGNEPVRYTNWKLRLAASIEFILSPKMRLRMLLIVMVIGLVLTRSRMGNGAFFSAMLIVGAVAMALARKNAPQTMILIASLVVIDVFVVGTWVGVEKVVDRIQGTEIMSSDSSIQESFEARSEAARTALAIVQDYPLVGTGGGSFYNIFLSYRTPQYGYSYVDHTHNDFVEIATDFGLIGLGILALLVASTLWTTIKVMKKRKSSLPWGMAFGVAMSIVALAVHSTVDFNLQIPSNALTITVILAMGWIALELPSPTRQRRRKHREQNEFA
ncbi:MAG: O-antigen ligase family protein [Comamonadaceae bacterium]